MVTLEEFSRSSLAISVALLNSSYLQTALPAHGSE
jgi:hypothetical protein